jgi:hypothetical protein
MSIRMRSLLARAAAVAVVTALAAPVAGTPLLEARGSLNGQQALEVRPPAPGRGSLNVVADGVRQAAPGRGSLNVVADGALGATPARGSLNAAPGRGSLN